MQRIDDFPEHTLIYLGDYVDDFEKQLGDVLDTFMAMERPAIFLKGNHEEEFLNLYDKYGTSDYTKTKILNHFKIGKGHVDWLKDKLVYFYENETAFFSHAGVNDRKSLREQTKYDLLYSAFKENLDHVTKKIVVQGHIPMVEITCFGNHWFVDTGCGLGGYLSALVYPDMSILSSHEKKETVIFGNKYKEQCG